MFALRASTGKAHWGGVLGAGAIEAEIKLRRLWKRRSGEWVACVEAMKRQPEVRCMFEGTKIEVVTVAGRKAAIAAARELLAKHAGAFDDGTEVEVRITPKGDWVITEGDEVVVAG